MIYGLEITCAKFVPKEGEKTAKEKGYKLVHKSSLQEVLAQEMEERLLKMGVRAERILEEVARVGFSDIRKLFNADGSLKSPKDWDPETSAAIAAFGIIEKLSGKGDDRKVIGHTKKVRLFDKIKVLDILAKHLKLYSTGDQRGDTKVHVRERAPTPPPDPKLSSKIIYLLKLAAEREKQAEATQSLKWQETGAIPEIWVCPLYRRSWEGAYSGKLLSLLKAQDTLIMTPE